MFEKVEVSVDIYAMIILEYLKPVSIATDGLFIVKRKPRAMRVVQESL